MFASARVLGCVMGLALSSGAFAAESVYQEDRGKCRDLQPISKEDEEEMVEQGQDIPSAQHCDGYKGYKVLEKWDRRSQVLFGYLSGEFLAKYSETFDVDNYAGDKIEWRLDAKGTPRAAILRYKFSNYNFDEKGPPEVLLISKVGQPESPMGCAIGMVDTSANKNANELARQVADEVEPGFECGRDTPLYHGKRSKSAPAFYAGWN